MIAGRLSGSVEVRPPKIENLCVAFPPIAEPHVFAYDTSPLTEKPYVPNNGQCTFSLGEVYSSPTYLINILNVQILWSFLSPSSLLSSKITSSVVD